MTYGFGVDLGGTTVKLACFSEAGELLEKWEIPTDTSENGKHILPRIAESIAAYRKKMAGDCLGIGIGVPGSVDSRGVVAQCVNLGWGRVDLPAVLGELTGLPVRAGNDATVAALGECWKGGGQGCDNMVFVTLGTGVGGGIVTDGRLINGSHGAGGEIGHMVLNWDEPEACNCGKRGCAEQYCSATGIVRLAKRHLQSVSESSVLRGLENMTCKDVFDAAAAGDGPAQAVLEQVYRYLGMLTANICCVADPEVVVLGGGVSKAGQVLLEGVARYYQKFAFLPCRDTRFALAKLGNDAGICGAFRLLQKG